MSTARTLVTYAPKLAGARVFIGIDSPDGRPRRLTIDMHREGSAFREAMHAVAELASLALAAGVPVAAVCEVLRRHGGGPSGTVQELDGILDAASVPDLAARVLELPVEPFDSSPLALPSLAPESP